jgi:hypothetical protein
LLLLHVPPLVASFNVVVPLEHKAGLPLIAATLLILTTMDDIQPDVAAGL